MTLIRISEENDNLASDMPDLVRKLDKKRAKYLEEVNAETVTLTRRNYVELLEGGWIENGKKRLAKLKAELVADPSNKQKAFQVEISQNHVNFQDKQLERSLRLIRMHEEARNSREKLINIMFRYILLNLMVVFMARELLAKSPNFIILYADDLAMPILLCK